MTAPVVMVVDDDPTARAMLAALLEEEWYRVVEVADGDAAIAAFPEAAPRLVLLDVNMPGRDGFATCRALRQLPGGADVPIIMLTGEIDAEAIARAYDAGATDFEVKSVRWLVLGQRIRFLLRAGEAVQRLRASEDRVKRLVYLDALTGLPNRLAFRERVQAAMADAARRGEGVAVLFLDLDDFKRVNDTLGHRMGDHLLQEVAARLGALVRQGDAIAARQSGDEFLLCLTGLKRDEDAAAAARRIVAAFGAPFVIGGREVVMRASIGIAVGPRDGKDVDELLQHADVAMYRAKRSGRNAWQFFDASLGHRAAERLRIETALRGAAGRGELALHYQPIIDVGSGRPVSAEALLRWQPLGGAPVSPAEFIPVAEETGLIVPIGEWVLGTALAQQAALERAGLGLRLAVNLSAVQLRQGGLAEWVQRALAAHGVPPARLTLEVTESVLLDDLDLAGRELQQLRALGVTVALDDFGTGYSSLGYLRRLPIDILKLDRAFAHGLDADPAAQGVVSAIGTLAGALSLASVAEGVETDRQRDLLAERGLRHMQGWLFAKAMPAMDFQQYLMAHRRPAWPR